MTNGFAGSSSFLFLVVALSTFASTTVHAKAATVAAERPLVKFHMEQVAPKVGQALAVFLQLDSTFLRQEAVLEVLVDGIRHDDVVKTSPALWIASFPGFNEIKSHLIEAKVFLRNETEAKRMMAAIGELSLEIASLETKIVAEENAERKALLEAELARKQSYLDELEDGLENLKIYFKSEFFNFAVSGDPENTNFPILTSVTPEVGTLTGGTRLSIAGLRLGANPVVRIGGLSASVVNSNPTEIEVVAPAFSQSGAKDIEVQFPNEEVPKNALLKGSFFATSQKNLRNIRPVAITNGYVILNNTGSVQLSGLQSYDENQDPLTYFWKILEAPKGSNLSPGAILSTLPEPTFTAIKKGVYVFELRVREASTPEQNLSLPAIATVEVGK